ncbi:MAG: carboxypeptidase-like regulatory domain-containing protein, partial [Aliifodinibius sp.]|nr:carboxypeptidase-like regulatory domain-containing protein [Fodinibius sp.]NIV16198.1 carboxypeptidase-like regulatory domain-containing protein [Fodinibius sp.]NIY30170.1 carboxypeptidase-like regulatory domain-containing protein [Fodinibius sp.]
MKTIRNRPYQGQQYLSINVEHNFRTIPFELLGLQPLVNNNIGFIVFAGAAKTWLHNDNFLSQSGFQPRQTNGTHWEIGASLNGILGLIRLDLATRIDQPAILVNISLARLF